MTNFRSQAQAHFQSLRADRARQLFRKGAWGIADHAQMSAANFVMTVLLARVLSPRDFGLYALVFTALLFINNLQSALVSQPHTMIGSPLSGHDFARYTTETMGTQVMLSLSAGSIFLALAAAGTWWGWSIVTVLVVSAPATAAWQMQEFIRRILYTRSKASDAFINDVISYGGQLVLIVILWQTEKLTIVTALLALFVTSLLGSVLGVWQIKSYMSERPSWSALRKTAARNWEFGKWLVGGHLATWSSGRLYPVLAAGLISVATTGAMKAVQTILGPLNMLTSAVDPILGPKASRSYAQGGIQALRTNIGRAQILLLLTVGAYCLVISIFARPILGLVYSDQYTDYAWLLVVMAINYTFIAIRGPMSLALTVLDKTSSVFRVQLTASIVNLTLGIAAVYVFRLPGIGIGILLNCIVLQTITWHYYLQHMGRNSPFARHTGTRDTVSTSPTIAAQVTPHTTLRSDDFRR